MSPARNAKNVVCCCILVPLNKENQRLKMEEFNAKLRNSLGDDINKLKAVFRLYGKFDYAIVTDCERAFDFAPLKSALRGFCDGDILIFKNEGLIPFVAKSGFHRVFCRWDYVEELYNGLRYSVHNFQNLGAFPVLDFVAHDNSNIIVSAASRVFWELDIVTDVLDNQWSKLAKKETFVVSSKGQGLDSRKTKSELAREEAFSDMFDNLNVKNPKKAE